MSPVDKFMHLTDAFFLFINACILWVIELITFALLMPQSESEQNKS